MDCSRLRMKVHRLAAAAEVDENNYACVVSYSKMVSVAVRISVVYRTLLLGIYDPSYSWMRKRKK